MKLSVICLSFAIYGFSRAFLKAELMDPTPVYVMLHCDGSDLASASMSLGDYAGKLLQDTYAIIHPSSELDDSNLTSLVFHGHGMHLEDFAVMDDAVISTIERSHSKATAVFSGLWNCRYGCPDDGSGIMKNAWEAAFASELASSQMAYFEATKSCSIVMDFAPTVPVVSSNAHIQIKCKGVHLKKATVAEATFAAHALEAAYNKVHGHHEGDNKSMHHVSFDAKKSMELLESQPKRLGLWYSQWWAMLMASILYEKPFDKPYDDDLPGYCWGEDDDDVRWWLSGIGTQKWETQFSDYLRGSEFKVFHRVDRCSITVEPTTELLEMLREDDCPKRFAATPTEEV